MKAIAILSIMITALSIQTMGSPCPIPIPAIVQSEQPDNRILIIGENHESLEQRAYTRSILPQLRNQGYDIDVGWPWKTDESPPTRAFFSALRNQTKRNNIKECEFLLLRASRYQSGHADRPPSPRHSQRSDHASSSRRLREKANYDLSSSIQQIARVPVFSVALSGGRPDRGTRHPFTLQAIKQDAADKWRFALTRGKHNADLFLHIPQGSPSQLTSISN